MAARIALLKYLRVEARPVQLRNPRLIGGSVSQLFKRHFSEEVRGSFLDKDEVRDRVINVVKNFQKVDPCKVYLSYCILCICYFSMLISREMRLGFCSGFG